jgi:hypothetical protein
MTRPTASLRLLRGRARCFWAVCSRHVPEEGVTGSRCEEFVDRFERSLDVSQRLVIMRSESVSPLLETPHARCAGSPSIKAGHSAIYTFLCR